MFLSCFYDLTNGITNCSDCVLLFVFLFITNKVENNDGVMSFLLKGNNHIGAYNIVGIQKHRGIKFEYIFCIFSYLCTCLRFCIVVESFFSWTQFTTNQLFSLIHVPHYESVYILPISSYSHIVIYAMLNSPVNCYATYLSFPKSESCYYVIFYLSQISPLSCY